jgi:hypothetical protein
MCLLLLISCLQHYSEYTDVSCIIQCKAQSYDILKKNVIVIIDFTTIGDLQIKMEKVSIFFFKC